MGRTGGNGKMEGWLYVIRSNRLGLQYSRKRYFVLEGNILNCFKSNPVTRMETPIRNALVDSCIRVTDNGRESINRKVFFIFTLYNSSNHGDQLKLGAASSEEAAKWISSIKEAASKESLNQGNTILACSKSRRHSRRLNRRKETSSMSSSDFLDWTLYSTLRTDPVSADVIAPSPWTILGCKNGLRLFKEAKDGDFHGKHWDDHPAIMAVGVVDATSESIFRTVMSLGSSRAEELAANGQKNHFLGVDSSQFRWDFCFSLGRVVEHLDGHTDIIHKQLNGDWLPWGMKKRDLLLRRYWRREDDGTYVILYHSVLNKKCPPRRQTVRACLKSGGYVISPLNHGKQSIVKHMLAVDWKFWKSYMSTSFARSITIRMLGRVAALREMFNAKLGNYPSSDFSSGELTREIVLPQSDKEDIKEEVQIPRGNEQSDESTVEGEQSNVNPSPTGSFLQLNDAADEFFDVLEPSEDDYLENTWSPDAGKEMHSQLQDPRHGKLSTAAVFVKKMHVIAVQKSLCIDLSEVDKDDNASFVYGATLPKDPSCNLACSWITSDPSTFLIRGNRYLENREKIKANGTLMQMVAADWLRSNKREDNIGGRPGSFVQKHAAQGGEEFFFIVNIQVPGTTTYSLVSYYMMDSPVENNSLLESFINGDDAYRNSRFKLIPYISKGSWIVKQSVGKKACLVGQALEINYFHGKNYLEVGIDVGSSTVARGVVSLVLGYLTNLVIELAFLIQANTQDELPEVLLGTCRFNHLDIAKAVQVNP